MGTEEGQRYESRVTLKQRSEEGRGKGKGRRKGKKEKKKKGNGKESVFPDNRKVVSESWRETVREKNKRDLKKVNTSGKPG